MKTRWMLLALPVALFAAAIPENPVWPRPVVVPIPTATHAVQQPVVSLNGLWKVSTAPPADFWMNSVDPSSWQDIRLPSHAVPQGVILPLSLIHI